jgi:Fic family protein
LFEYAPIESVLCEQRASYQAALEVAEQSDSFDAFLEQMLEVLLAALQRLGPELRGQTEDVDDRLTKGRSLLGKRWFSRKEYLAHFPKLSTASASRDLARAASSGALHTRGEGRATEYRFR